MVKRIFDCLFDQTNRLDGGQLIFRLPLKLRIADKDREHNAGVTQQIFGSNGSGFFDIGHFAVFFQTANQGRPEPHLMGAAFRGDNRVAVRITKAVFIFRPGNRPFDPSFVIGQIGIAGKRHTIDGRTGTKLII